MPKFGTDFIVKTNFCSSFLLNSSVVTQLLIRSFFLFDKKKISRLNLEIVTNMTNAYSDDEI
jgi:hypothetical protein